MASEGKPGVTESLFQSIVVDASDGIVVVNADGHVTFCNPAFANLLHRSQAELNGELFGFPLAAGNSTEIDILRRDGTLAVAEMRVSATSLGKGRAFVAMLRDISDRKQAEAELIEALNAARLADQAKDEFLANVSHELRTPLSAVIGFSGLAQPLCTDSRQREYLDKVKSAGSTLSGIINDLLDVSKIAAGRMELDAHPFSLRQLVLRSSSVNSYRAQEKSLQLIGQVDDDVPDVLLGDSLRIEQILLNLLSNAVKFTAAGQVALRVGLHAREAQRVCLNIEVEDTGIGLSDEEIALLFKPFRQADASMTRKFGGTGLGLVICKRLAELMGGEISVSSRKERGSVFTVQLWLALGEAGDLLVVPEEAQEWVQVRYENARVLVVDDQPFNRDVVEGLLAVVGIVPHHACNGQEALDILSSGADVFDMVLMDIQMPLMDGLTATRAIRRMDGFASLPIVAMTAHTMTHERGKASDAGMNDHIGKPFDEAGFYRVLAKWISPDKQRRQACVAASPGVGDGSCSLPSLRGVDMRAGLALMIGDEVRYRHWLGDFVSEAPVAIDQIRRALAAATPREASLAAHVLKGRSGMLGMNELHARAAALESAIDCAQQVEALLCALEQDVTLMCAEIRGKLGLVEKPASAVEVLPAALPTDMLPPSVTILVARLQAGDSDCDRIVAECLVELKDTVWAALLQRAATHIQHFDFAAAGKLLTGERQAPARES